MVAEIFLFPDLLELEMGESQMSSLVLLGPLAPMTPLGLTSRRSNYAGTTPLPLCLHAGRFDAVFLTFDFSLKINRTWA